jgi:hypothetical protein
MKTLLTVIGLLSFYVGMGQKIDSTHVVGTWLSDLDEDSAFGSFIFDKDGFITIESEGIKIGGANGVLNGKPIQMTYHIDVSKTPIELDIIAINVETKAKKVAMKAIIEFNGYLKMKIALGQGEGPTEFTTENSMMFSKLFNKQLW